MLEEYFRRALLISQGDLSVFVTSPISATMLGVALILIILVTLPSITQKREVVFKED